MPKVSEAHVEARRQQILEAALACFLRKGFHQTTTDEICAEAALSPGALYSYYPSKESIIQAIGEQHRRRNQALVARLAEGDSPMLRLHQVLVDAVGNIADSYKAGTLAVDVELWAEALRNPGVRRAFTENLGAVLDAMAAVARRAQSRGQLNGALDPDAVAQVGVAFFQGLVLQKALDPTVDVWKYLAVVEAMMAGTFWQAESPVAMEASK
jgi:TetR/AcrR family transcriptional regulator, repressor for uid operon